MPKQQTVFRCLLISPSDVKEEREALSRVTEKWNAQIGSALNVRVDLVKWESHATPDMSGSPQDVLNKQIVDDCDLGIAVFWYRIGTPTDRHPSGSFEEIHRLIERNRRVMVYFCNRPIKQSDLKDEQYSCLQENKSKLMKYGLVFEYGSIEFLESQVLIHLTQAVVQYVDQGSNVLTASIPDVRVTPGQAIAPIVRGKSKEAMSVSIENHSPVEVFISTVSLELKGGRALCPKTDAFTGKYQYGQTILPGRSTVFFIDISAMAEEYAVDEVECIRVTDQIGRIYRSEPKLTKSILEDLLIRARKSE